MKNDQIDARGGPGDVLVVQTGFLGDAILGTSLTESLRRSRGTGRIGYAVRAEYAELFANCADVDVVFPIRKRDRRSRQDIIREISGQRFDAALIPHRSFSSGWLAWRSKIPRRIGFRSAAGGILYTERVDYRTGVPEVLRNLELKARLTESNEKDLPVPPSALVPPPGDESLGGDRVLIAVAYGSVWETKQWGSDRYTELCRILIDGGFRPILIGSPAERAEGEKIAAGAGLPVTDLVAGELTLTQLASLLRRVDLTVSNDSGAMHLSEAVGTPVVTIFGPTVREFGFSPILPASRLVDGGEKSCRPCGIHGGVRCPLGHHRCMKDVSVEAVYGHIVGVREDQSKIGV